MAAYRRDEAVLVNARSLSLSHSLSLYDLYIYLSLIAGPALTPTAMAAVYLTSTQSCYGRSGLFSVVSGCVVCLFFHHDFLIMTFLSVMENRWLLVRRKTKARCILEIPAS